MTRPVQVAKRIGFVSLPTPHLPAAIRCFERGASGYPARLEALSVPPERVWALGTWPIPQRPVVAIVGARAASGGAMARTVDLAAELTGRGALVISGGAIGIDAAAHLGALRAGGPTVAVVAPGLDAPYPQRHEGLFAEVVATGGALFSIVPPGTLVQKWHFPARNHVIAALADAVVVTECGPISGSAITARAARSLGKVVLACPGSPGGDALCAAGAALCEHAGDIFAALAGRPRLLEVTAPEADGDAARTLAALDPIEARNVESIAAAAGLSVRLAARSLSELELSGLAVAVPGARYLRSAAAAQVAPPSSRVVDRRSTER